MPWPSSAPEIIVRESRGGKNEIRLYGYILSCIDGTCLGIVRITAQRRHWTKNVERLCGTELAPRGKRGGAVQLEICAAVEMALLIEMMCTDE